MVKLKWRSWFRMNRLRERMFLNYVMTKSLLLKNLEVFLYEF